MNAPLSLVGELPKQLTDREECALLERALARRDTPTMRLKLAQLHNRLDAFGESIALIGGDAPLQDHATARTLVTALLGRGAADDLAAALTTARRAEALAPSDPDRAEALVDQAQALLKLGDPEQASARLSAALDLDPSNGEALRILCTAWLAGGEPERALALCDALAAHGVAHAQLLGIKAQALAQSGDVAAARSLVGLSEFLFQTEPAAPEGWADLAQFHAALMQELLDSPGIRVGRHGTASIASLRVDEPARASTPAMLALQQLILDTLRHRLASLPEHEHPWLRVRPAAARLRMWSVITGAEGRERWHMHPLGWASGGYYVAVPESVAQGDSLAGCLEFGLPSSTIGRAAAEAFGTTLLRPRAGLLSLFPSHAFHRTHPHGAPELRICIAFDLIPQ